MYAHIVFPIASFRSFIYKIPHNLEASANVGCAVKVLFKNKLTTGHIESIVDDVQYKGKINSIKSICIKQSISKDLWKTVVWMSRYYVAPLGLCIKSAIPSIDLNTIQIQKDLFLQINKEKIEFLKEHKFSKNQQIVINKLLSLKEPISIKYFKPLISNIYNVVKKLSSDDYILKLYLERNNNIIIDSPKLKLSKAQNKIFNQIYPHINQNEYKAFLIHGIPGSGKTEIYIKLAQETINHGKNVIILIPEIILTTQMKDRFFKYFGNRVAVWHSKMTVSEKKDTLKKIDDGDYNIIIGARSCIFSSLPDIGLIVIDEEQDSSYKQESPKPYYNARDVGFIRAMYAKCPILLTSATPSLESYYNSIIDKISIIQLNETYYKSKPPLIKVVNMLNYFSDNGEQIIISPLLLDEIKNTISNNGQCIILNNRRGYATSVFSKSTNNPISCDFCDVPMSYHKSINRLLCHYCDSTKNANHINNNEILLNGYGTEKIKEILKEKLPDTSIAQLDSDTLRKKETLTSILSDFKIGKTDILIGTQMLSKGLDFDNVKLVGVINSDYGMFIPDFRSGEKTFQIIAQVIGRSGRRNKQGVAIIQTYNPDNPNLVNAMELNSKRFYSRTLAERNELSYPPFTRLCRITFSGENLTQVQNLSNHITDIFKKSKNFKVLGPAEAPISKIKNEWRINSLIFSNKKNSLEIQHFFNLKIGTHTLEKAYKNIAIRLDIDPVNML